MLNRTPASETVAARARSPRIVPGSLYRPAIARSIRLLAFGLIALLVLYLVYVGSGWAGVHSAVLRQTSIVLVAMALAAWLVAMAFDPRWRPHSVLWPAFAAALFAYAIATAASRWPRMSVEYLAYAIVLAALYLLLRALLTDEGFRRGLGLLVVGLCGLTGGWYVLAVSQRWIEWWDLVGLVTAPPLRPLFESLTFGNPSAVLTMSVLLFASSVGVVGGKSRLRVGVLVVLGALTLFAVLVSGSRSGWLAVAAGLAISGLTWVAAKRHSVLTGLRRLPRWSPVMVVPLVAVGLVASPGILSRLGAGGEALRTTYLATAARMWADSPIVGTGPGSWVAQRIQYTRAGEQDFYIPHAHNLYAQVFAEFGIAGIAAGIVVVVALARLLHDGVRATDPDRHRMAWVALFVTVYFGAHQLLDFYANMPAALFAFAVPIAWLDATAERHEVVPSDGRPSLVRVGGIALGAAVAVAMMFLLRSEAVAVRVSDAVSAANRGDWSTALQVATAAVAEDADIPAYQLTLGLAHAQAGNTDAAAAAFQRAAEADGLPESWLNLAAIEAERGRVREALEALDEALRLGIQRPAIALAGGHLAVRLGDDALAIEAFARAIEVAPTLAGDPWWLADDTRAAAFRAAISRVLSSSPPATQVIIALECDEPDLAWSAIASMDAESRRPSELLIRAWQGDSDALNGLMDLAASAPVGGNVSAAALVLSHLGHTAAGRFQRWANIRYAGTDPWAYEVRVASDKTGEAGAYSAASFYGHYTYRRPTPSALLVPPLPYLELK